MHNIRNCIASLFVFLLPLAFFAYQFVPKLLPMLITEKMMNAGLSANQFNLIVSAWTYGVPILQIPFAILVRKYEIRKLLSICILLSGISIIPFLLPVNFWMMLLGRFVLGLTSGVAFLSTAIVTSQLYSKKAYSIMLSLAFSIGFCGAVYAGEPIGRMINELGLYSVVMSMIAFCVINSILVFLFLRTDKSNEEKSVLSLRGLWMILKNPIFLSLGISNLLMSGSYEAFANVWGALYFRKMYFLSESAAAGIISYVFIGMIVGGPIAAFLGMKFGYYRVIGLSSTFISLLILYACSGMQYHPMIINTCLFFIGVLSCSQVLIYSIGNQTAGKYDLAVVAAFLNCVGTMAGMFFHTLITVSFFILEPSATTHEMYDITSCRNVLMWIPAAGIIVSVIMNALQKQSSKSS
ncbi:Putative MFS transporter [Candidatus Fokinia solitaria]|uniref:MFS transporter n=1 Tax=Candidatus Fokinia solitaria TaxID=1802984 RepID=A0A2U8BRT4_9RICK|nr:MFS transporter [Candidatus Fokinia solitaria]AWD33055.1 Putative MFS transporter [Candidatus Fokinia solitaria]